MDPRPDPGPRRGGAIDLGEAVRAALLRAALSARDPAVAARLAAEAARPPPAGRGAPAPDSIRFRPTG